MPYSIMIDAGHGGSDPGAVYKGRREKDDNLALAMEVGRILSENGVDVLYTRTTDDYISPLREQGWQMRRKWIFLSLFTGTAALR